MSRPTSLVTIDAADTAVCLGMLRRGSKSFALAHRLLPAHLKGPTTALYAFCREADDAIDEAQNAPQALLELHKRLDRIFVGVGTDSAVDRALAQTVRAYGLPRPLFDALLEGFAWDAQGRSYETLSDVVAYSARVASTVGVLMTLMMGRREPWVLGRAAELGVAMQLTNIARDVGDDRRIGRVYLPTSWLAGYGVEAVTLMTFGAEAATLEAQTERAVQAAIARLLACAEPLYRRADGALGALPFACRMGIDAAARIYRDIGRSLAQAQFDSLHKRAYVRMPRKLRLVCGVIVRQMWRLVRPVRPSTQATLPELQFLIDAVHPQTAAAAPVASAAKRAHQC